MAGVARTLEHVADDVRRGWRVGIEDLCIAALVTLPFTVTLAVLADTIVDVPSPLLIVLTGVLQGVATFWNAGWRARTSA
jgi:hypothetical protein